MNVINIDRRLQTVSVRRVALQRASENALAANQNASDALARAEQHIWSGNRGAAIHALGRIGFEIGERTAALMVLTELAETACPDGIAQPGHGRVA